MRYVWGMAGRGRDPEVGFEEICIDLLQARLGHFHCCRGAPLPQYPSRLFTMFFNRRPFPVRVDGAETFDNRRCLFLTFSNSKFTGGTMMIAPKAEIDDGLVDYVRWGPIGRLGLMRNLPGLYDGTHIEHALAERNAVRRVEFNLDGPADVMVDGEVLTLHCEQLDVLPGALNVVA